MTKEITHDEFIEAMRVVNAYRDQLKERLLTVNNSIRSIDHKLIYTPDTIIAHTDISTRLSTALHRYGIWFKNPIDFWENTISDLSNISARNFILVRGNGKHVLEELSTLCNYAGLHIKL